jgi:hypothetical protein
MKNFSEDLEMVLTIQDKELNEWNIEDEAFTRWNIEEYTEIEDEAFTRWKLFTFYLLDPDSEARLV